MKHALIFTLLLISIAARSQNWTAALPHVTSITGTPSASGSWIRLNTTTGNPYQWNPNTVSWVIMPDGIDVITGSIPPAYTPSYQQSNFAINAADSLYYYRSGAWRHLNPGGSGGGGGTYTAGTGIAISGGNVISNTGDLSTTNEIQRLDTATLVGSTLRLSLLNDAVPFSAVDLSGLIPTTEDIQDIAGGMVSGNTETRIALTYDDTGGKINAVVEGNLSNYTNDAGFLTAEVDGSTSNELQNLSLTGQSLAISSGTGVTLPVIDGNTSDFDLASGVLAIDYTNAQKATALVPGLLSSADWTTFNGKQAAGNYITDLTGDVTATGPGSASATVTKINGTSLAGLATGILKNTTTTGVPSIAVAGDFPTLNQNTTGSAATLTTPRAIYGNNFDGSADLAQIIASTYGGTGNGFAKLSGPTTTEKTYTLPNASATILTDNAAVTAAQGGTGQTTYAIGDILQASASTTLSKLASVATGNVLISGGVTTVSSWGKVGLTTHVSGILPSANGGTNSAFMAFSGPATSVKTYTLPNTSTTILTTNAAVTVAQGGTGRATSTTAYGLIAAGTTATGAHQTLAAGATTQILVGGGASALPQWTTATGSGEPVRATSPTLVTPLLGTPTSGTLTNCTGLPLTTGITGTLAVANGGTGATTLTGLLQGNGTGAVTAITNSSTAGQTLRVTGASTYAWGALDLADADAVTGVLPYGNVGAPYKIYVANITQSGTSDPVATVLENTLGVTPTWARTGVGVYTVTATGAWVTDKTALPDSRVFLGGDDQDEVAATRWIRTSADVLTMRTLKPSTALESNVEINSADQGFTVTIKVYN